MAPRPILKARLHSFKQQRSSPSSSSCNSPLLPFQQSSISKSSGMLSPHVHFPPTPVIASTLPTHSPSTYDRAPIAVSPNSCELPERGGRVYSPNYTQTPQARPVSSYFDPMSFKACSTSSSLPAPDSDTPPPSLIRDTSSSSESEDSDEYGSPMISPPNIPFSPTHTSFRSIPMPSTFAHEEFAHALSFLPHAPSLVKDSCCDDLDLDHNSNSNINRNSFFTGAPSTKKKFWKRRRGSKLELESSNNSDSSAFEEQNLDGCLGGF